MQTVKDENMSFMSYDQYVCYAKMNIIKGLSAVKLKWFNTDESLFELIAFIFLHITYPMWADIGRLYSIQLLRDPR